MAACYDPQMMPASANLPNHPNQSSQSAACVGLLYDSSSNRTFRIPDVPQTSTVAHIKQWYASNVGDGSTDPRSLVVIHNAQPAEDGTQVWQLAQGQGQFAVTVAPAHSPRSILELYVDTALPIAPVRLCISSDSSVLYVKQRLFEMLNLPMAMASANTTTLMLAPASAPLQNNCTLDACRVLNNARLVFSFQGQPEAMPPQNVLAAPLPEPVAVPAPPTFAAQNAQSQFARIQEIWASDTSSNSTTPASSVASSPVPQQQNKGDLSLLPSLLLEDDEIPMTPLCRPGESMPPRSANLPPVVPVNRKSRSRRNQRSRSPPGGDGISSLNQEQLQHLAANFRTKSCRNGPSCKFGRNCWFAHNSEELRKPTDPLPNNLPAVHKLERYSHREANATKERN